MEKNTLTCINSESIEKATATAATKKEEEMMTTMSIQCTEVNGKRDY